MMLITATVFSGCGATSGVVRAQGKRGCERAEIRLTEAERAVRQIGKPTKPTVLPRGRDYPLTWTGRDISAESNAAGVPLTQKEADRLAGSEPVDLVDVESVTKSCVTVGAFTRLGEASTLVIAAEGPDISSSHMIGDFQLVQAVGYPVFASTVGSTTTVGFLTGPAQGLTVDARGNAITTETFPIPRYGLEITALTGATDAQVTIKSTNEKGEEIPLADGPTIKTLGAIYRDDPTDLETKD